MGKLIFLDTGTAVDVPEDPEGERAAVADDPEFQRALTESRRRRQAGARGTPLAEVLARYGVPPAQRPKRPSGKQVAGDNENVRVRLPRALHRELAEQAERQGVSLNTLIVAYLAREAAARSEGGLRAASAGRAGQE